MTRVVSGGYTFYMDKRLDSNLTKIKNNLVRKDTDRVIVVDGAEGCGKSVFSMQVCKKLDDSFDINRVAFNPEEFKELIVRASSGQAILFDEAFTGLSSRGALSVINRLLVSVMMEMRQKNLIVVITMPTFFLLDKYVALWRAKDLFHVYTKKGKRGYWMYFNKEKKKLLYLYGKETYSYKGKNIPKSNFYGQFFDQYVIDEDEYRLRKAKALSDKELDTNSSNRYDKFMNQRDKLLLILRKEFNLNSIELKELLLKYDVDISSNRLRSITSKKLVNR